MIESFGFGVKNPLWGMNQRKLKELELGYRVASFFKQHPAAAVAGSAGIGAAIGGFTGHRIGKL